MWCSGGNFAISTMAFIARHGHNCAAHDLLAVSYSQTLLIYKFNRTVLLLLPSFDFNTFNTYNRHVISYKDYLLLVSARPDRKSGMGRSRRKRGGAWTRLVRIAVSTHEPKRIPPLAMRGCELADGRELGTWGRGRRSPRTGTASERPARYGHSSDGMRGCEGNPVIRAQCDRGGGGVEGERCRL